MGMERVRQLAPYVKEAFHKTAAVAKTLCFLHVTDKYLCSVNMLVGPSMLPTIDNSLALSESISTRQGKVGSGDIVIIRSPVQPATCVAKRIKAVEGDVVSSVLGSHEPKTVVVPKGHVWIEGDNMHESRDSREYGPVPYAHIRSRIFFVFWPPKYFRLTGNKVL